MSYDRRILERCLVRNLVAYETAMLTGVHSLVTYETGILIGIFSVFTQKKEMLTSVWRLVTCAVRSIVPLLTMGTDHLFPCTELQSIQTVIYIMLLCSAKVC